MHEKVRVISESAFRNRVREAAYHRSELRKMPFANEPGNALSDWLRAEWDQRQFLFFYGIWVVPDEWFDVFVRFTAHEIWRLEYDAREKEAIGEAHRELVNELGREPNPIELHRRTRRVYEGHWHRDAKSDWRRARYEISGGLDIRGRLDDPQLASQVPRVAAA